MLHRSAPVGVESAGKPSDTEHVEVMADTGMRRRCPFQGQLRVSIEVIWLEIRSHRLVPALLQGNMQNNMLGGRASFPSEA